MCEVTLEFIEEFMKNISFQYTFLLAIWRLIQEILFLYSQQCWVYSWVRAWSLKSNSRLFNESSGCIFSFLVHEKSNLLFFFIYLYVIHVHCVTIGDDNEKNGNNSSVSVYCMSHQVIKYYLFGNTVIIS